MRTLKFVKLQNFILNLIYSAWSILWYLRSSNVVFFLKFVHFRCVEFNYKKQFDLWQALFFLTWKSSKPTIKLQLDLKKRLFIASGRKRTNKDANMLNDNPCFFFLFNFICSFFILTVLQWLIPVKISIFSKFDFDF